MIFKDPEQDRDKWKITRKGRQFLDGEISLPKYAFIYNGETQSFSAEMIEVYEVEDVEVSPESVLKEAHPYE